MKFNSIRYYSILFFVIIIQGTKAQEAYKAEIGPLVGTSFYLGDANKALFANSQLSYGVVYRHKFNPRLALAAEWSLHNIMSKDSLAGLPVGFKNEIHAIDLTGEFNFFGLENKSYRPFSQKYSTFILAGVGGMAYPYEFKNDDGVQTLKNELAVDIIFGAGFKLMLGSRVNLNVKWINRLSFKDNLEGKVALNNPYDLNGSNILNNDLLSSINVSLTYNIFKERCDCHNNWR